MNMKTKTTTLLGLAGIIALLQSGCASGGTGAAAGARPYPFKDCLVSDNELGSMGTPVTMVHEGQTVKFCCKPCVKEFKADPQKYMSKFK